MRYCSFRNRRLLSLLFSICTLPAFAQPSDSLEQAVLEMATNWFDSTAKNPIIKWSQTEVYGAVIFEPYHEPKIVSDVLPLIESAVEAIRRSTGVSYQFLPQLEEDRPVRLFTIVGTDEEVIKLSAILEESINFEGLTAELQEMRINGEAVCSLAATWSENYAIEAIAVVLDIEQDLGRCVVEMFLSSVGLPGELSQSYGDFELPDFGDASIDQVDEAAMSLFYSDTFISGQQR